MQHGTSYSSTHSFKTLHFLFESRQYKGLNLKYLFNCLPMRQAFEIIAASKHARRVFLLP